MSDGSLDPKESGENLSSASSQVTESQPDVGPTSPSHTAKQKVDVLLKPAGDAPIMRKKKWAVERTKQIGWVSEFIKKYIKSDPSESLFLYVNQSFCPSPDSEVGTVYDCFGSDGKLVLHYCKTQAWG
ncbi:ubiquitin-like protein ATG12 [Liolophura sinensis]|uniref:ubiquitin-like protein ATG12 n=1 Tax=Liolophura sinensis TaxID=3198878 RepID=UPI0031588B39